MNKRVLKGAKMLDEMHPGWHAIIDLDTLDVYSHDKCILAQLENSRFNKALEKTFKGVHHSRMMQTLFDHGFFVLGKNSSDQLTKSWKKLITARRLNTPHQHLASPPS